MCASYSLASPCEARKSILQNVIRISIVTSISRLIIIRNLHLINLHGKWKNVQMNG